jgi:hypothetical protein
MGEREEETNTESQASGTPEDSETTDPGDWERKPGDESEMRHDDDAQPPVPPEESSSDDEAEQEAGDAGADKGYDEPESEDGADLEDAGTRLEDEAQPFLEGPEVKTPVGSVPTRSLIAVGAFVMVFCLVFFVVWALLDDSFGIFLGIVLGAALAIGAVKLLADRERAPG